MEKMVLAEFIYKLGTETSYFCCGGYKWSSPSYGYSYNVSLPAEFMQALRKSDILKEPETPPPPLPPTATWPG